MPRRVLTLEQKLESAINKRNNILAKYNNDRSYIVENSNEQYKRTKNATLKAISNDYISLHGIEKNIHDLEKILDEKEDDNDDMLYLRTFVVLIAEMIYWKDNGKRKGGIN